MRDEKEQIQFYGGPSDGARITAPKTLERGFVPHPCADFQPTEYVRSLPWPAHFSMPVFVPLGFPGMPPKEPAMS